MTEEQTNTFALEKRPKVVIKDKEDSDYER